MKEAMEINKQVVKNEIDKNYEYFKTILPKLLIDNRGKFALLRKQELVDIFDTELDALRAGKIFKDSMYSVQEIKDELISQLGFFSTNLSLKH